MSKNWALVTGDGVKTVHVQFSDFTGYVSTVFDDNIILDTTLPGSSASSPATSRTCFFTVTWSGSDALSGIAAYTEVNLTVGQDVFVWIT